MNPFRTISGIPEEIRADHIASNHEYAVMQCQWYNESDGKPDDTGIDCPVCKNKLSIAVLDADDNICMRECRCVASRRSIRTLQQSGLQTVTSRLTFDSFTTAEDWQRKAKALVMRFLDAPPDKWLYVAGQSGCGKTHLCTAACTALINSGNDVKYLVWRSLFHDLQGSQFKTTEYQIKMLEYQNADVLYIDDFLKPLDKKSESAEISFAYEIINARYISGKKTIISSELHLDRVGMLDRAIAGRISEKARGHIVQIEYVRGRNYREKDKKSSQSGKPTL